MNEYPYDATYDPPIPTCDVALTAPSTGRRVTLTAIVDTGTDTTIVPVHYLHRIGARRSLEATLRSQWGEPRTVFLYLVNLRVSESALPGVYVVGDELGDEVVLGRNVLNRLRLLLDGPVALMRLLSEEL